MKRSIGGGAHRGPVAPTRQRRTIRFVQLLLVLFAAGLLVYAGFSMGRRSGFEAASEADSLTPPRKPAAIQTVVLVLLGSGALGAAFLLGGPGGVRVPSPQRLDELAGRAETVAKQKAEEIAAEQSAT